MARKRYGLANHVFNCWYSLVTAPAHLEIFTRVSRLLVKSNHSEQAKNIVSKIAPQTQVNANTQLVLNESTTTDAPVRALFQQGRTFSTFMFWIAFFMCLLMVYALGSWLPKLMLQAGYSLGASMLFLLHSILAVWSVQLVVVL